MAYDQKTIEALATLRLASRTGLDLDGPVREAFDTLDNAGVFAALDEQNDYASAEDILSDTERNRARAVARGIFAGLLPGITGANMANEVADRILSAVRSEQTGYSVAGDQPEDETCMDEATRPGWINETVDHYRNDT